jgi:hypothetical protein
MLVLPAGAASGVDEGDVLLPHAETHITEKRIAQTRKDIVVGSLVSPQRKDAARPESRFSSGSP